MAFVLQDVIKELEESLSLEPLKKFKKENLVKVALHFGITPAVSATKSHILDLIEDNCIENNIIDEVQEKPTAESAESFEVKTHIILCNHMSIAIHAAVVKSISPPLVGFGSAGT